MVKGGEEIFVFDPGEDSKYTIDSVVFSNNGEHFVALDQLTMRGHFSGRMGLYIDGEKFSESVETVKSIDYSPDSSSSIIFVGSANGHWMIIQNGEIIRNEREYCTYNVEYSNDSKHVAYRNMKLKAQHDIFSVYLDHKEIFLPKGNEKLIKEEFSLDSTHFNIFTFNGTEIVQYTFQIDGGNQEHIDPLPQTKKF